MRKVIAFTTVAVGLIAFGSHALGGSSRTATPAAPAPTIRTTTTPAPTTTTAPRPKVTRPKPPAAPKHKLLAQHAVPKKPKRPAKATPAQIAALRTLALQDCIELASANNMRVIAANRTWYLQQLALAAHKKNGAKALHDVLVLEEESTRSLIDAQYTIDDSNCYIKYA